MSLRPLEQPEGRPPSAMKTRSSEKLITRKPIARPRTGANPVQLTRSRLVIITNILLLLAPLLFIALTIASAALNGSSLSLFGSRIAAALQLAPTLFPIVFAAVCAHLMRSIALYKSQSGLKMLLLEHLVGAQSLYSSIEKIVFLRNFTSIGFAIVLIWLLSPLGGQALLRLISTEAHNATGTSSVCYLNQSDIGSEGGNAAAGNIWGDTTINLYLFSILSASQNFRSPMDAWNNVKIPSTRSLAGNLTSEWAVIPEDNGLYSGLIGIPVGDIPSVSVESNFIIPTYSMEFECYARNVSTFEDFAASLPSTLQNVEQPYDDVNLFPDNATQFLYNDEDSRYSFLNDPLDGLRVYYGSKFEDEISFTYCNMTPVSVEANVTCIGRECSVNALRQGTYEMDMIQRSFFGSLLGNRLWIEVGLAVNGFQSSRTEYFLFDPEATVGSIQGYVDLTSIPLDEFAYRLTMAFNSFYVATGSPLTIAGNSDCTEWEATDNTYAYTDMTVTRATGFFYVVDRVWLTISFITTIFLQVMAITAFIMWHWITVPDIYGYASSLVFDNSYCREKGLTVSTALDGSDRAVAVGDTRFMLADIRSEKEEIGKIAFVPLLEAAVADDEEQNVQNKGQQAVTMTQVKLKRWYD